MVAQRALAAQVRLPLRLRGGALALLVKAGELGLDPREPLLAADAVALGLGRVVASLRVFLCIGGWLGVVGDAVSEVDA